MLKLKAKKHSFLSKQMNGDVISMCPYFGKVINCLAAHIQIGKKLFDLP